MKNKEEEENEQCQHEDLFKEYISQPYGNCVYCGQTVIL